VVSHFVLFGVKWVMLKSEDTVCCTIMVAKEAHTIQDRIQLNRSNVEDINYHFKDMHNVIISTLLSTPQSIQQEK
jgi:hypothetical protein